jgi:predicted methyltransferase
LLPAVVFNACAGTVDPEPANTLSEAIAGAHRPADHRARDAWRHPSETLSFFGLRPDMTVVEVYPGGGWYTEILAPALRDQGKLIAAHYGDATGSEYRTRSHDAFVEKLEQDPATYGRVEVIAYFPPERTSLGPAGSADMVVTFRNLHGMVREGKAEGFFVSAHEVLKAGGVLGVVQHRAPEGADPAESAPKGYVPEETVLQLAQAAGFVLGGRSEINANPRDTKDYPDGVWTLPPSYRLGDEGRERYAAIGESDRMTLRFEKPGSD